MEDLQVYDKNKSDRMREMNRDKAIKERKSLLAEKAIKKERETKRDLRAFNLEAERRKVHPDSPEDSARKIKEKLAFQAAQTLDEEKVTWADMDNELLFFDRSFRALADYFDVESKDYGLYKNKLQSIYEWASRNSKKGLMGALAQIKTQERKLGSRPLGDRLSTFYKWAALDNYTYQTNQAKKLLER